MGWCPGLSLVRNTMVQVQVGWPSTEDSGALGPEVHITAQHNSHWYKRFPSRSCSRLCCNETAKSSPNETITDYYLLHT